MASPKNDPKQLRHYPTEVLREKPAALLEAVTIKKESIGLYVGSGRFEDCPSLIEPSAALIPWERFAALLRLEDTIKALGQSLS